MVVVASYIFGSVLSFIGALYSKRIKFFEYIVFIILVFLIGRGANTLDTNNYLSSYNIATFTEFGQTYEKGYLLLIKIGQSLNLDYIQFRLILVSLSLLIISNVVKKLTKNVSYVYFFYLLFLVFIDTVQIRNFFAFAIVLYGLHFLLLNSKSTKLYYILFILLASTIHISSLIYLLFLLVNFRNKKKLINALTLITVILCLFIYLGGNNLSIIKQLFSLLDNEDGRLEAYVQGQTKLGFLYAFGLHFIGIIVSYFARNIISEKVKGQIRLRNNKSLKLNLQRKQNIIEIIFWINIISIIFFPLYMTNLQFIRLSRNLIILNLIASSLVQVTFYKSTHKNILLNISVFIMIFCWWYFTFVLQDHIEDIVIPFFDDKTILM